MNGLETYPLDELFDEIARRVTRAVLIYETEGPGRVGEKNDVGSFRAKGTSSEVLGLIACAEVKAKMDLSMMMMHDDEDEDE